MLEVLAVGLGGFVGCTLRFGISKFILPFGSQFPVATLVSNVAAGFLIGFLTELEKEVGWITPRAKLFLTTGMLGGLSTFSTFSLETLNLIAEARYLHALANVSLNLVLSFLGVICGAAAAKFLCGKGLV